MLPDFVSDGCTWFPDVWRGIDLYPCCFRHDLWWFLHPGDWLAWAVSNINLGVCFVGAGAWELFLPALGALFTIGAAVFALKKRK